MQYSFMAVYYQDDVNYISQVHPHGYEYNNITLQIHTYLTLQLYTTTIKPSHHYHPNIQALNMPPLYADHARGRALIMNNVSSLNSEVPTILDPYSLRNLGTKVIPIA
jgi:hypothetical protein